ncbi:MAG: pyruvate kinase [Bacilli bacterium]|nr:pyruvate kinase [Bacilli bacterium]
MLNISKKTKIVATIGPASNTLPTVEALIDAGINVMRVNFSHGNYESHQKIIDISKALMQKHIYVPIMLDTAGPEIRCRFFEGGNAEIIKDSEVRIHMENIVGNATDFSVNYENLIHDIKVGDAIKIDDGKLRLDVVSIDKKAKVITTKAFNTHIVKDRKGVNIPTARLKLPSLSEKDKEDIAFGVKAGVNIVAASFTRTKNDMVTIKDYLRELGGSNIQLFAKIENMEGVENIKEILEVADGIMIARGDMGVEIAPELVPVMQSDLILECRKLGKPVIVATQMLDSMQLNPLPTRAEVSDVATAIKEGADAVMLSAETASGLYPVESAAMQQRIAITMEQFLPYTQLANFGYNYSKKERNDAIATSVASTANLIDAKAIVCFSETGNSAIRISKSRPKCPIVMITSSVDAGMKVAPYFGIFSIVVKKLPQLIEDMEAFSLIKMRQLGLAAKDNIIITGGTPTGTGTTNFLRIVAVNELGDI